MAAQGDPYSSFYDKLQLPHPLVQRFAVNAIFQRLKCGPSHTGLQSPAGQEAFARCLTSTQPAVMDQTVKEICKLCAEGALPVERGLQDLQAALDAVDSESVAAVINGIGFLCRVFLQRAKDGKIFTGKSGNLIGVGFHPFVKTVQSRTDEHRHILRQMRILLQQASPKQQMITLEFLQPFITFSLLQPSLSASHALFARDLHSQLCLLSCQSHDGVLLEMLINYIQYYSTETAQVQGLGKLGSQLLCMLIGVTNELLSRKVSLYYALVLVNRMVSSLRLLSPKLSNSVELNMVSLAHMLAMVDLEQDQLLLLDIGLGWVEEAYKKGKTFGNDSRTSPVLLLWVFPALHVMSYPSATVKIAAIKLLRAIERAVEVTHVRTIEAFEVNLTSTETGTWGQQHLAVVMYRLVHSMWSEVPFQQNLQESVGLEVSLHS